MEQKIISCLWFDKEGREAAQFYVDAFGGDSKIDGGYALNNTPSGDGEVVHFNLLGHRFAALSAGPHFKINPSISYFVNFDPSRDGDAKENLKSLWDKLSVDGTPLMDLSEYPFSKYYGWIKDRYGVSWQLILTDPEGNPRPPIVPSLLFTEQMCGKAGEAAKFYVDLFKDSKMGILASYKEGEAPNPDAKTSYADFMLENVWFAAMDSGVEQDFKFSEAISLMVMCDSQEEIDYYWEKLSADPTAEQCGWLKDKYGVSWQITPRALEQMLMEGSKEQVDRVVQTFLQMKKLDIGEIERSYNQE